MKIRKDAEGFATCCARPVIARTCRKNVNASREMYMINNLGAFSYALMHTNSLIVYKFV